MNVHASGLSGPGPRLILNRSSSASFVPLGLLGLLAPCIGVLIALAHLAPLAPLAPSTRFHGTFAEEAALRLFIVERVVNRGCDLPQRQLLHRPSGVKVDFTQLLMIRRRDLEEPRPTPVLLCGRQGRQLQ